MRTVEEIRDYALNVEPPTESVSILLADIDGKQHTIDALVAALEHIQRHAKDRSEKAWFRLDIIADEADAALALARGEV